MRIQSTLSSILVLAAFVPAQSQAAQSQQGKTQQGKTQQGKTQQGKTQKPADQKKAAERSQYRSKIEKRILKMRDAMRAGQVRNYNVYVRVRLKNSNKLKGVVKNGRFIEAQDGLDFVTADRTERNAGLRVWYTEGTNSFIFVPYKDIALYKIGRTLSEDQVKSIENDLIAKRKAVNEKYRALVAAKKAASAAAAEAEAAAAVAGDPASGTPAPPPLTPAQLALLAEFPADQGWGEAKIASLKLRRITTGVYPNKQEKKFEGLYDDWAKALEAQQKLDAAKLAAEKAAAEGTGVNKDGSFTGKSVVAPPIGTGTTAKLPSGIPPPSPIKGK